MTEVAELSQAQQQAANEITQCYQELLAKKSNVSGEILKEHETIYQWDHYPKDDVRDKQNHTQYYYHSHPSNDSDRLPEHGHFHLFLGEKLFPQNLEPMIKSKKYLETKGKSDALSHFIAIAMDEFGFPKALFTTNHWLVCGLWYPAEVQCELIEKFVVDIEDSPYAITNRWLTNMVILFKPQIQELILTRDEVIKEYQQQHPDENIYEDHDLEVTSILRLG